MTCYNIAEILWEPWLVKNIYKLHHLTHIYFRKVIDCTFYWFTLVITHKWCWESTRAFSSWLGHYTQCGLLLKSIISMKMQNATNCKTEESNHAWIPEDFLVMLSDHTEQWSILPDLPTLSKIKKRKWYFLNAINNLIKTTTLQWLSFLTCVMSEAWQVHKEGEGPCLLLQVLASVPWDEVLPSQTV